MSSIVKTILLFHDSHLFCSVDPNVGRFVTPTRMKSSIQRARSLMYPRVPITLQNLGELLQEHQHLTKSIDGTDNLLSGVVHSVNGHTSVIIMSRRMRRFLRKVKIIFCDGTFGSRPHDPDSSQVLQILTVVRNHVSTILP